jgi:hypothetical protein
MRSKKESNPEVVAPGYSSFYICEVADHFAISER